jgi:hypothetical protein
MEVGHIAAYGSYAEGAGGMTDLHKHVRSSIATVTTSSP